MYILLAQGYSDYICEYEMIYFVIYISLHELLSLLLARMSYIFHFISL